MKKTLQDSFLHELGNIASECSYLLVQKHFPETLRQGETLDKIQIRARENVAYRKYLNLDKKMLDVDSSDFYQPSPLMDEIENNVSQLKDDETEVNLYVRSLLWPFKIYGEVFYLCDKTKEKAWEYVTENYIFKVDVISGEICHPNGYVGNVEMTLFLVQPFVTYFARRLADILALRHYSLMKIQERYGLFIALFEKKTKCDTFEKKRGKNHNCVPETIFDYLILSDNKEKEKWVDDVKGCNNYEALAQKIKRDAKVGVLCEIPSKKGGGLCNLLAKLGLKFELTDTARKRIQKLYNEAFVVPKILNKLD